MTSYINLAGRILLALMFLMAGLSKIGDYAATQGYMEMMGVPGMILPLVIALEVLGASLLIVGWQTRWSAYALAAFTLVAALTFHRNFADQMQMILFMKNLSIVGGLLLLAVNGAGALSLDTRKRDTN